MSNLHLLHVPRKHIELEGTVFIGDIPEFSDWREMRKIEQKNSEELLFFIRDCKNRQLALKLFKHQNYDYFHQVYQYQKQIEQYLRSFPSFSREPSVPLRFGLCDKGNHVYFIQGWKHDYSFQEELGQLQFYDKIKPALCAATYIKAVESIPVRSQQESWCCQVMQRLDRCFRDLDFRSDVPATVRHFERFYQRHQSILEQRQISVCYRDFTPREWYAHPDGSVRIPLIDNWIFADCWYHFRRLLTDIYVDNEFFAVVLIDMYFKFSPPKDFFICLAIYTMLDLLEQLCRFNSLRSDDAKPTLAMIRRIDQMYAKFTRCTPVWYKILNKSCKEELEKTKTACRKTGRLFG